MGKKAPLMALIAAMMLASACSKGSASQGTGTPSARPSSTAHIKIVEPTNGETFSRAPATVDVKVDITGAKIVPATTTHITPDTGHLHVYLDNQVVSMNFGTTDTVPDVPAGMHILRVEFVASDHLPFDPRVIQQVTFEVKP
jgi:hypothetical protein